MKQTLLTLNDQAEKILEDYCKKNNLSKNNGINMIICNYNTIKKEGERKWNKQ